mgnify:CR=1 FL=1
MKSNIPNGWKKKKIREFTKTKSGGTPSTFKPEYWENGDVPWLPSGELQNCILKKANIFITKKGLENSAACLFPTDSILIALTGATTGKIGYLTFESSGNQSITAIFPSKEHYPKYLYYYLQSIYGKIYSMAAGGAQTHINKAIVDNLEILLPPEPEQEKIAEILANVDENIEETDKIIAECERIKKGLMQSLLTRGIPNKHTKLKMTKLGEIPNEWDVKTLFEITDEMIQGINTAIDKPEYVSEGIPILKANDIIDGNIDLNRAEKISQNSFDSYDKRFKISRGDFLYSNIGARLGSGSLYCTEQPCAYAWNVIRMNPKKTVVLPEFLSILMNSPAMLKEIKRIETGSGMGFVPKKNLEKIKIPVPLIEEQKEICEIIERIENRLSTEKKMLVVLSNTKKSLMQKLLSGEMLVKV